MLRSGTLEEFRVLAQAWPSTCRLFHQDAAVHQYVDLICLDRNDTNTKLHFGNTLCNLITTDGNAYHQTCTNFYGW